MTTFVLNSAVLTAYGEYLYTPADIAEARQALACGFTSAIGHTGSAEYCSTLLGIPVRLNRVQIEMQPGDHAVVIRIKERLPEGRSLTLEETRGLPHEIGILKRMR